jgi:broad specificity phosphatase PhoE
VDGELARRLLLVRAGATSEGERGRLVGAADPPLSALGHAQIRELARHWEWADALVSSPARRAWESAAILARGAAVRVDSAFRPLDVGRWEGLLPAEAADVDPIAFEDWEAGLPTGWPPRGEDPLAFRARVADGVSRCIRSGWVSPLIVCHGEVIREIARACADTVLPPGRPAHGELLLLTRTNGRFRCGRASSDPEPLRSALERTGLSAAPPGARERHVGHLELRMRSAR